MDSENNNENTDNLPMIQNSEYRRDDTVENIAIGTSVIGGVTATAIGIAASTSATATISAIGVTVGSVAGGITGGVVGSGIGLASGGAAMAATIPLASAGTAIGAALGSFTGPALAAIGIGTAPVWAMPVAIAGGIFAVSGLAIAAYKFFDEE